MSLIIIDGLDGSGKTTQTAMIADALTKDGTAAKYLKFPCYDEKSSALVRMYLDGEIAKEPGGVNPYAAAAFYACDRYISYLKSWGADYHAGKTIICDRYTTSNAIHQTSKQDFKEWDTFLRWLDDFEYGKLNLPRPDLVIYLDMDTEIAASLVSARCNDLDCTNAKKKDIHEQSLIYLQKCRKAALYAAEKLGWQVVKCFSGGEPLPKEEIHSTLMELIWRIKC